MSDWLDTLVKYSMRAGVVRYKYLFATAFYGIGHIHETDVLRKWSKRIYAEIPQLLRSKTSENTFLLSVRWPISRTMSWLSDETLQDAKISKLLIARSEGGTSCIPGKNLSKIMVNPDEGNCMYWNRCKCDAPPQNQSHVTELNN